jgi:hypothetical protein
MGWTMGQILKFPDSGSRQSSIRAISRPLKKALAADRRA